MYHDTIHIKLKYNDVINFNYGFYISKHPNKTFSPIKYKSLLYKFKSVGFVVLRYLKFNDIEDDTIVYCSYNFQPNFEIFFKVYNKLIKDKDFDIIFEYGNIINGKFYLNNMNNLSSVYFYGGILNKTVYRENIIGYKVHQKISELYQIVDKDGNIIATEWADYHGDFKQNFFERYDVKVALRKYKLSRLKEKFK